MELCREVKTSIGPLWLRVTQTHVTELSFTPVKTGGEGSEELWEEARRQLEEYLDGARRDFDLPLEPRGTEFQKKVWTALCRVPYGQTASYGEIAHAVGNGKAARAVGMANNRNPLPIFIPCHRIIGADGSLTGYGGGMDRKILLLELEKRTLSQKAK